jgi:hypothetical protein
VHLMKRSLALVVAAVAVAGLAVGCSSSRSSEVATPGTDETVVPDSSVAVTSDSAVATSSTVPAVPAVNGGDVDAFCAAWSSSVDFGRAMSELNLMTDGLVLLAAPDQARGLAGQLRANAPLEVTDPANAFAGVVEQTGQALATVHSLRQLSAAVLPLVQASDDPNIKPMFVWVGANCDFNAPTPADQGPDQSPDQPTIPAPEPPTVSDPAADSAP